MKSSEIEIPSNRKFGIFVTFVLAVATFYLYCFDNVLWANFFAVATSIFLFISLIKDDALLPLNKLWMRFGLLTGRVINPIVLGIIFFGLFTPIAILMRFSGRDELRLNFSNRKSHWITRSETNKSEFFENQF